MTWPEISIEDFPPRRDDEPSSLRQDIIDELSDHFVCALNRELLKNSDERLAQQRVIQNFGDPIKIARQLWLDAMKEKIMSQRIMTGISAVMAVCCIAVVGFAWILVQDSRVVNQKMLAHLAAIADRLQPVAMAGREQQILDQLKELKQEQQAAVNASSEDMNQITFQLVQDNKDKSPAIGFTGTLSKIGGKADSFSVEVSSDDIGKLGFGKLPSGKYSFSLNAPWGENYETEVFAIPGRELSQMIVCPAGPPELISVKYDVHLEEMLETGGWYLLADFRGLRPKEKSLDGEIYYSSERQIQDEKWITQQDPQQGIFLIGKDNRVTVLPLTPEGKFKDLDPVITLKEKAISVPAGRYTLPVINLIHNEDLKQLSRLNDNAQYAVLTAEQEINRISTYYDPDQGNMMLSKKDTVIINPFETMYYEGIERLDFKLKVSGMKVSDLKGIQLRKMLRFDAVKGERNVWNIEIPQIKFTK